MRDDLRARSVRVAAGAWLDPYWPASHGGAEAGLWRPVTTFSYALGHAVHGPRATGFHATNVALHAAVTFLLWHVLRGAGRHWGTAFAGSLLFAVHPLLTEAVDSISGRAELLAALGSLAAWLCHRRAASAARVGAASGWGAAAALAWMLAILSKESAILVPLLFFLDSWSGDRSRSMARRRVAALGLGHGAALALVVALRWVVLGSLGRAGSVDVLDNPAVFEGPWARIGTALWVQLEYVRLFLWPHPLSSDYSLDAIPVVRELGDPRWAAGALWLALLATLVVVARRRSPPVALGAAWWLLALLPGSNLLFPAGTVMGERLAYLAAGGGVLIAGHALAAWAARGRRAGLSAAAVLGVVAITLGALTVARVPAWRDNRTLARTDVRAQPRSAKLHAGLGIALHLEGDRAAAEAAYRRALEIHPGYAQVHYNLGRLLIAEGRDAEAVESLGRAAELAPHRADAIASQARALDRLGRTTEALDVYDRAVRLEPGDAALAFDRARALLAAGRSVEAVAALDALASAHPYAAVGRVARALVADARGDVETAIPLYRAAAADAQVPEAVRASVRRRLAALEGQLGR